MKTKFKISSKIFSLALSLCLVLTMMPLGVTEHAYAAVHGYNGVPVTPEQVTSDNYVQLGLTAENWSSYSGWYAIRNAAELYGFANLVNGGNTSINGVLLQDITVNETVSASGAAYSWTPIGSKAQPYLGNFDGNGHTVRGLYINSTSDCVGMFGVYGDYLAETSTSIQNLTIANSYFCGNQSVGGIAGALGGDYVSINRCRIAPDVAVCATASEEAYVGGIVGNFRQAMFGVDGACKVTDCVVLGNVDAPNAKYNAGAVVGFWRQVTNASEYIIVSNCYYLKDNLTVSGETKDYGKGGMPGYTTTNEDCNALSAVTDAHTCVWVSVNETEANCLYPGITAHSFCLICDSVNGTKIETPANDNHSYVGGDCVNAEICEMCGGEGNKHSSNHISTETEYVEIDSEKHALQYKCCGALIETGTHTFSGGDCVTEAICKACKGTGQKDSDNHVSMEYTFTPNTADKTKHDVYHKCCEAYDRTENHGDQFTYSLNAEDSEKHDIIYACCNAVYKTAVHTYVSGVCQFCDYQCSHSTITDGKCTICKESSVRYLYREWNGTKLVEEYRYTDVMPAVVNSNMTRMFAGWYVVTGDVSVSEPISVYGAVNLILCDGATLRGCFDVMGNATLSIYAQSDSENAGKLEATGCVKGSDVYSGIGGSDNNITIVINGGAITAKGAGETRSEGTAAIGGPNTWYGNLIINGGVIQATGGKGGAGIGGGDFNSGTITINGGTVTASGGTGGAGIGGGFESSGGTITINGGTVTASGGSSAAGIGGGDGNARASGKGGNVTINGGNVTANGAASGAGIGGGNGSRGGNATINGGTVTACGGHRGGAGIGGGGNGGKGADVIINGGNVYAFAVSGGKAIGQGYNDDSSKYVSPGTLKNGNGSDVFLNEILLSGVSSDVSVEALSGVTYGLTDVETLHGGKLYFYLPSGAAADSITADKTVYFCRDGLTYYPEHSWSSATCCMPESCVNCGLTRGEKLEHSIVNGICTGCGMNEEGYFYISTADQLMAFAYHVNNGNFNASAELMADINLTGYKWIPIAETAMGEEVTEGYTGTFDGNGHVIKNVSFRDSALHETAGIFGTVQSGGMVQKLGVENFTFERGNTQDRRAGGIAGQLMSGGTITDCYVINSTIKVTGRVVGGIAGLNKGNVENCFTAGLGLDGYSQRFGGITGDYAGGSIVNCYTDYAALGSTASSVGTAADSEAGISEGRFSSGEITYKLNGSRTDEDLVWYQTLTGDGKQDYPQFAGSVVYHDSINDSYGNHIHNWIYTKSDNTITATCNAAGCPAENGDGGSVTIAAPGSLIYTGSAIEADVINSLGTGAICTVEYGALEDSVLTEGKPVNVGSYTASITLDGKTISAEYTIAPAPITGAVVSVALSEMTYDGQAHTPDVTVTLDGKSLTGGTDYTVSYSDNTNAGTAKVSVTGKGNYKGTAAGTFTINPAKLTGVSVSQTGTLKYDGGKALTPVVTTAAEAKGGQTVTFIYSLTADGEYGSMPSFTEGGIHKVYYKAKADNHEDFAGSFEVSVANAENAWITVPSIEGWTYGEAAKIPVAEAEFGEVKVTYTGTGYNSETVPTEAGSYKAVFTVDETDSYAGLRQQVEFTIAKAEASCEAPAAKWQDYSGVPQNLIEAGQAAGGEMQYALGTDAETVPADGWSSLIPQGN